MFDFEIKNTNEDCEIWKTFIDLDRNINYSNIYEVSNLGRVKSFRKSKDGIILDSSRNSAGYNIVHLRYNKLNCIQYLVHKLVLYAFKPSEYKSNYLVRHLNDIKIDNELKNLKWGTYLENAEDAKQNGCYDGFSKLVDQYSEDGVFIKTFRSIKEASRILSIDRASINNCCLNNRDRAKGYRFAYYNNKLKPINHKPQIVKKVYKLNKFNSIVSIYNNCIEAKEHTGIAANSISEVCRTLGKGRRKTAGGWKWLYEEDYNKIYGEE